MINIYKNGIETAVTPNSTTAIIEQMDVMGNTLQTKLTAIEDKVDKDILLSGMDLSKYKYFSRYDSLISTTTQTILNLPNFSGYIYAIQLYSYSYAYVTGYTVEARCSLSIGDTLIIDASRYVSSTSTSTGTTAAAVSGYLEVGDITVPSDQTFEFNLPISTLTSPDSSSCVKIPKPIRVDNQSIVAKVYSYTSYSSGSGSYTLKMAYIED